MNKLNDETYLVLIDLNDFVELLIEQGDPEFSNNYKLTEPVLINLAAEFVKTHANSNKRFVPSKINYTQIAEILNNQFNNL